MINIFTVCSKIPLLCDGLKRVNGIAFDGCNYYLTSGCDKIIAVLDKNFKLIRYIEVCRVYTWICFDPTECCFWAASNQCEAKIFKLSECFVEFDCIEISSCGGAVTGVSYCCQKDKLLVSMADSLLLLAKDGEVKKVLQQDCDTKLIVGALCANPLFFYISLDDCGYSLNVSSHDNKLKDKEHLEAGFLFEATLLNPCKDKCGHYHIYLLACKLCGYPYIINLKLDKCLSDKIYCCNEKLCEKCCKHECDFCGNGCNDVLESIALQEAALAHILNAEGEKLQKAIADDASICELLEVNESVQRTITHATHFEQVLFNKLEALSRCCDFCKKPHDEKDARN